MQQATLVNNVRAASRCVLDLIERAQAEAAAMVQEWNKLGGATFLTGFDYTGLDVDADDVSVAVTSLAGLLPDVLGDHGTNLYKMKD